MPKARPFDTLPAEEYAALQPEADFQKAVIDYARLHDWQVTHVTPAKWTAAGLVPDSAQKGFPDLMFMRPVDGFIRPYGLVFAELKKRDGRKRPGQQEWIDSLVAAGVPAFLWRPADWPAIERVLR